MKTDICQNKISKFNETFPSRLFSTNVIMKHFLQGNVLLKHLNKITLYDGKWLGPKSYLIVLNERNGQIVNILSRENSS